MKETYEKIMQMEKFADLIRKRMKQRNKEKGKRVIGKKSENGRKKKERYEL